MKHKTFIKILPVITILVLLVMIGLTFAYFSVNILGNDNPNNSIITKTAHLGLFYDSGPEINGKNIKPGWSASKEFTVTNTGSVAVYYTINWSNILNNFVGDDLVYSISGAEIKNAIVIPNTPGSILENVFIEPEEVHTFTLTVTYINRDVNQIENFNKTFMGTILINETAREVPSNIIPITNYSAWFWKSSTNLATENSQLQLLELIEDYKIDRIYMSYSRTGDKVAYKSFVEKCSAKGIEVWALTGDPSWIEPDKKSSVISRIDSVLEYNESATENQKFKGIHWDVEPHGNDHWDVDEMETILMFQDYILMMKELEIIYSIPFGHDIPFWLEGREYDNKHGIGNLAEFVFKHLDNISIMAYRDTGERIIDIVIDEIEYAILYNKNVEIGVENTPNELDKVTFYEEGTEVLFYETNIVNTYYKNNYEFDKITYAIHDVRLP